MKQRILSSLLFISVCSGAFAATQQCSRANLTRCLDSVCAINISSNPAARCQYCGSVGAGTPPNTKMKSVSVGASAKYNISDKELKKARLHLANAMPGQQNNVLPRLRAVHQTMLQKRTIN